MCHDTGATDCTAPCGKGCAANQVVLRGPATSTINGVHTVSKVGDSIADGYDLIATSTFTNKLFTISCKL